MELKKLDDFLPCCKQNGISKRLVIVRPEDDHTVTAFMKAAKEGVVNPVLVGDEEKIRAAFANAGCDMEGLPLYTAAEDEEAVRIACGLVRDGEADFLMKGLIETKDLLKGIVSKETGLRTERIMSKFDFIENPGYHKLIALSDSAMNPKPDLRMKKEIIENALDVMHAMGMAQPKVAVLAAAETLNPKLQESVDADALKKMWEAGELTGCYLEGPISIDLAMEQESVDIKGYDSPVGGDADLLICPDLVSGNMMGKGMLITGAKAAGIITGARVPVVLMSRAATVEDKFYSILLGALAA